MRVCNVCKTEKPLDDFYRVARFPLGRDYTCKLCNKVRAAEWRKKNPDRSRSIARKSATKHRSPERSAAGFSKWYHGTAKENGGLARMNQRARLRQLKLQCAQPFWADQNAIDQTYRRAQTMSAYSGEEHQVDHIVPLQSEIVCGLHAPANLRVITAYENRSKRNFYWPDMPEAS